MAEPGAMILLELPRKKKTASAQARMGIEE
jgi:hypothetical protein